MSKRETLERATALKGPLFAPRAIFIFLTRNNTQSKSFHLAFFLFLAAGQGEEEASVRTFPLLRPQMEAVLRPCSLPYVMYVHVMCVHVCRRFGAWPCLGITHCTTLTRIYNLVGSHFPNSKIQALALTLAPGSLQVPPCLKSGRHPLASIQKPEFKSPSPILSLVQNLSPTYIVPRHHQGRLEQLPCQIGPTCIFLEIGGSSV